MKTTNFKNSKKLADIGFKAGSDFSWNLRTTYCGNTSKVQYFIKYANGFNEGKEIFKSYDLETLLEIILGKKETSFEESLVLTKNCISYESNLTRDYIDIERVENESLADTAARLLVKLVRKGLINLKGE